MPWPPTAIVAPDEERRTFTVFSGAAKFIVPGVYGKNPCCRGDISEYQRPHRIAKDRKKSRHRNQIPVTSKE